MKPSTATAARSAFAGVVLICAMAVPFSGAFAVSSAVRVACMSDYFAYCSRHEVGSSGLRQCMRSAGSKLSKRCINALVSAGEVSKTEVARRAAERKGIAAKTVARQTVAAQ